jgi:hypothetical protein
VQSHRESGIAGSRSRVMPNRAREQIPSFALRSASIVVNSPPRSSDRSARPECWWAQVSCFGRLLTDVDRVLRMGKSTPFRDAMVSRVSAGRDSIAVARCSPLSVFHSSTSFIAHAEKGPSSSRVSQTEVGRLSLPTSSAMRMTAQPIVARTFTSVTGEMTPRSVTMALISRAGVTSNAGFQTSAPSGTVWRPNP